MQPMPATEPGWDPASCQHHPSPSALPLEFSWGDVHGAVHLLCYYSPGSGLQEHAAEQHVAHSEPHKDFPTFVQGLAGAWL